MSLERKSWSMESQNPTFSKTDTLSHRYWINYACLVHLPATSSWTWRAPMILQIIPALALFAGYAFCPESPRYLALRGRMDEAKKNLMWMRSMNEDHPYFIEEFREMENKLLLEQEQETGLKKFTSFWKFCVTDPSTRARLIFVFIIQTLFIMSGGNSITYYAPTILGSMGLNSTQVLLFTAIYGLVKVVSAVSYTHLTLPTKRIV